MRSLVPRGRAITLRVSYQYRGFSGRGFSLVVFLQAQEKENHSPLEAKRVASW